MQMLRELKAAAAIPGEAGAEVGSGLACGGLESDKGMTGGRQEAVRQPGGRRATFSPPPEACGLSKPSPARRRPGGAGVPGSRILSVGLIALVGVLSGGLPSMAQVTTACTPPAGLPPLADPPVTAQQVETGTGSLKDFALAVREQARAHARRAAAVEEGVYIACVMRQEGGPWRWGATYNVSLTLDGRVFVHAKDMALSGRLLNQSLYREILAALGVSRTDLADLASPDPAARSSALNSIFATLSREPDAPFDATSPLPGVRPGIPGASGYASVYVSSEFRSPIVLLAGFDIDASHMEEERLDFGDPAVTAREVVDRETLKAFVTQAGNWFLEISEAGDPDVASRARIALRDPNGPWRHGSVYLYVLDTVSDVIVFHGAFPNQWEYRPLNPTARDTVTGELILPQIIAAAKSGPEGGFVEYHFDDPADDSDSAEIPKVGYAREFSGQIRRLDGNTVPLSFIVGSGIYNAVADSGATEAVANDDQMPTAWLSRFGRTVAEQALDGVAARIATPRMPGLDATLAGHAVGPGTDDAAGMTPTERRAARAERDAARAMAELARALAPDADPEDRFGEGLAARGAQSLDGDGALAGTAFTLTTGTDGAGGTT
ncbi:MAG: hypothetical protein OXH79_21020, partial [Boseongicola sp.]|nr:hypothetical protein [Boseongicola sp.]